MDTFDAMMVMYRRMQAVAAGQQQQIDVLQARRLRSETAGGVPASDAAALPTAASGGLSDGTAYIDVRWATDGLKPGEVAGAGTGCLVTYNAATDQWLRIGDYTAVTT